MIASKFDWQILIEPFQLLKKLKVLFRKKIVSKKILFALSEKVSGHKILLIRLTRSFNISYIAIYTA